MSSWSEGTGRTLGDPPRVVLSAFPRPVPEGSSVTVTVRLMRALSSAVTIPLTVTRDTSEAGDHGTLASITIEAGATTGTGTIATYQDPDPDDEIFTVALGTLPASVRASAVDSVTITIQDDDGSSPPPDNPNRRHSPPPGGNPSPRSSPGGSPSTGGARPSPDASLRGLTGSMLADGAVYNGGLSLTPTVRTVATTRYTATVPYTTTHVTLTPAGATGATGAVSRAGRLIPVPRGQASPALGLDMGPNIFVVLVTAEDGIATQTYPVTVTRQAASTDATLRGLTLSAGPLPFTPATTTYTVAVAHEVTRLTVTPTPRHAMATVTVNGAAVPHGQASAPLPLAVGTTPLTVVVTAEDDTTTQTYTVTVTRAVLRAATAARLARVQDVVAPQVIRAMTAGTLEAVTTRLEGAPPAATPPRLRLGGAASLAEALYTQGPALAKGTGDLRSLLTKSAFTLPLRLADTGPLRQLVLWGSGDYRRLSGGEALGYTGDVVSGHVGAELTPVATLRTGLALSWARGALDYTERHARGTYERTLTTVTPYVGWTGPLGLGLWATAGYGWGELALAEAAGPAVTRDLTQQAVAGGVRGPLLTSSSLLPGGTTRLTVHGETAWTWATVDAGGGLAERTTRVNRQRLRLAGQHEQPLGDGGILTPTLEVGLRHDGGTGVTGASVETGGGVRYTHPGTRLTIETRGRVLLAHQRAYEEWGVSGLVQLAPLATGEGLAFRLAPAWGVTASGVDRVWATNTAIARPMPAAAPLGGRVDLEVGYGVRVPALGGLVTPFTGLAIAGPGLTRSRVGLTWLRRPTAAGTLAVEVAGEQRTTAMGPPDQRIGLQVQLHFNGGSRPQLPERQHREAAAPTPAVKPSSPAERLAVVAPARAAEPRPHSARATTGSPSPGPRVGAGMEHETLPPRVVSKPRVLVTPRPASRAPAEARQYYFVQLGAFAHPATAVKATTTWTGDLADLLRQQNRQLAVVASKHERLARVLVAPAFRTRRAAATLCAALQARGPDCYVTVGRPQPSRPPRRRQVADAHGRD